MSDKFAMYTIAGMDDERVIAVGIVRRSDLGEFSWGDTLSEDDSALYALALHNALDVTDAPIPERFRLESQMEEAAAVKDWDRVAVLHKAWLKRVEQEADDAS